MSRIPIRTRLTLAFAGVMALVLVAVGLFTYYRVEADLNAALDRGLSGRAADVGALLSENDGKIGDGRKILGRSGDTFLQVLLADGTVDKATRTLPPEALVDAADLSSGKDRLVIEREYPGESGEGARVLAEAVDADGRPRIVVVGTGIEQRDDALSALRRVLLIGSAIGLLIVALAGYLLAKLALRPVEAMRRRAASVTEAHPERRLPLPAADDELRLLATTLNSMLDRLDTALTRERGFVADASHELRTPLAALKAEVEVALDSNGDREELRRALGSANIEVDRLAQLAEDLLVIARSDRGQLPVRREAMNVRDLLARLGDRFGRRLAESGRELSVDAPADLVAEVDPLRAEQALGNLVDNALRHGAGTIRCQAVRTADGVELSVTDEGPGFEESLAETAFERFTRGDPARGRGGSGLGLAIVRVIAEAHGGDARVFEARGGGAGVALLLADG